MTAKYLSSIAALLAKSILVSMVLHNAIFAQTPAHPNDPLSFDEVSKASLLTVGAQLAARSASVDVTSFAISPHEVLLIERNEEKGAPNGQRRADVFVYDYANNELIQSLVDLNTSQVINSERKQGVQLPLTNNELVRAKQIVFEDEDERAILEEEFSRITSRQLASTEELNIKAFTFHADSLPNRVNEATKHCGIHRCAQLMLYTDENIVFEISPIVNLSEGVVTQRIGF